MLTVLPLVWLNAVHAGPLLSESDLKLTRAAFKAGESSEWVTAYKFSRRIKNPIATKLLTWRRLSHGPIDTKFSDVDIFLRINSDWPGRKRLLRQAERLLSFKMKPEKIIKWFGTRTPESGAGWIHLGLAHIASNNFKKGRKMLQHAWIEGDFSKFDAKTYYRRIRKYLTKEDSIKRMDRLLWEGKTWAARRLFYKVPKGWQKLAQARYSLRRHSGNVDYLISKVPKDLISHPGLIYERVRWRRRKGKDSAFDLLESIKDGLPRPELWWREKALMAHSAVRKRRYVEGYNLIHSHGLEVGSVSYAEAEWLAGWIALRFLKDPLVALSHFERMYLSVKYPISIARAAYWAGRAANVKDGSMATRWYKKAAVYPLTFYGQLAFNQLYPNGSLSLPKEIQKKSPKIKSVEFAEHELVKAVKILFEVGANNSIWPFIRRLYNLSPDPYWISMTARLASTSGRPDLAIRIAKRANREGINLLDTAYPILKPPALPNSLDRSPPEMALTLSVIRQESAFRFNAKSSANARGLMQIIPQTAIRLSKTLKLRYSRDRLMDDPNYNMMLGQSYLSTLIKNYKGSYILALAAYNAGPKRVKRWLKAYGDPRDLQTDAVDWIELIPFSETRNYVQRVLENLQVYRARLANHKTKLGIANDLHL